MLLKSSKVYISLKAFTGLKKYSIFSNWVDFIKMHFILGFRNQNSFRMMKLKLKMR